MKEELKKYFNINIYKVEEERRKLNDNYILYYELLEQIKERPEEERKKAIEEYNKQQEEREKQVKLLNNKIDILTIQKNLLYNNIIYLFYKNYHNKIMEIMEKYQNKSIGEKTREKLQNEIKEELKKDNLFINVYFSFGSYSCDIYQLNFTIYQTEEEQKNYSYNKIGFTFNLCDYYQDKDKESYKNYFIYRNDKTSLNIINNNKIWDNNEQYNYINDTRKQATIILKESKKSIEKVKKLIKQAAEEREKQNNLLNQYKIHDFDNIKINYQQTI